jgi:hypothetical protein
VNVVQELRELDAPPVEVGLGFGHLAFVRRAIGGEQGSDGGESGSVAHAATPRSWSTADAMMAAMQFEMLRRSARARRSIARTSSGSNLVET